MTVLKITFEIYTNDAINLIQAKSIFDLHFCFVKNTMLINAACTYDKQRKIRFSANQNIMLLI